MKRIVFYLAKPFLLGYSKLPLSFHYWVSDWILYPVLYQLVGYRKKVVTENLRRSFPSDSVAEIQQKVQDFYHYLTDLFVETIKGFTISDEELRARVEFDPFPVLDEWFKEGKSAVLSVGHYGNYEWVCMRLPEVMPHDFWVPYRQLTNPYFDALFTKSRSKLGAVMFPTFETYQRLRKVDRPMILGLANDQASPPDKSYWTTFLNQDTSFFWGTERIAKMHNWPVFYMRIHRPRRGFYRVSWEILCEEPKSLPSGAILERHARWLEADITKDPRYWLWSHRRWKHQRPSST